jgi:hypothetical protein
MVLTAPIHSRMRGRFRFYGMVGEIIMVVNVQKRVKKEYVRENWHLGLYFSLSYIRVFSQNDQHFPRGSSPCKR